MLAQLPPQTHNISQYVHRPQKGNPVKVAATLAIKKTGLWDAFEFKDALGQVIRCERANLKNYGLHWRIHHANFTYIIPYDTQVERVDAARKVQNYLVKHAQWNTMQFRGDSALDYWQDARSHRIVIWP